MKQEIKSKVKNTSCHICNKSVQVCKLSYGEVVGAHKSDSSKNDGQECEGSGKLVNSK